MKDITEKLIKATGRSAEECTAINEILNSRFILGHNNKDKIITDLMIKLHMNPEEAALLYNQCAEVIVKEALIKSSAPNQRENF